jgi:hypothetical protein
MGFALWIEKDTAWCAGTHEYRPMGVAVIAATSLFAARDFHLHRAAPADRSGRYFCGLFASLPAVNMYMEKKRGLKATPAGMRPKLRGQLNLIDVNRKNRIGEEAKLACPRSGPD